MMSDPLTDVALLFEDDSGKRNEGRLNLAWSLAESLQRHGGQALAVPSLGKCRGRWAGVGRRSVAALRGARRLRASFGSRPGTLVYIPDSSLTLGGIVRGLLYRTLTRSRALTVVAAQRHECNCAVVALTKRAGGRIVTLDSSYADSLKAVGIAARSVVPGVDRSHFRRCTDVEKRAAKETLGLDARDRCVLHLGHLNKQRHLDILVTLAEACKARVVMVAGSAVPGDDSVVQQLVDAGVLLVRRDFSDIRDVYCAADVYVFPTLTGGGAIGFPLSVLEALSVGLPVVSTPFNDLPGAFPEGSGVTYAQTTDEFALQVNTILTSTTTPAPSENRLRAWDEVLQEIVYG